MALTPRAQVLHDLIASARAQGPTRGAIVESAVRVFLDTTGADIVAEGVAADTHPHLALASVPLAVLLAALEARGVGEA